MTWRRMPGGGYCATTPSGLVVFARAPKSPRWDGAKYEYGTYDGNVYTPYGGARTLRSAKERAEALEQGRLKINPEPLKVVRVLTCTGCRKRAPWCSCGKADYR